MKLDQAYLAAPAAAPNVTTTVSVIGLGYVGLPLAVALARHFDVTGIDVDARRVAELREGQDRTHEVTADVLAASALKLSDSIEAARGADVIIVTVPTPVDSANLPDLGPVMNATRSIASVLEPGRGTVIVYESTVYPGVTDDLCGPLIEKVSGLKRGLDFRLGYSPERINPGDREHSVERITKVVAGETPEVTDLLASLYGAITSGGAFKAASIRAAEAAKVIENAQRDINIAFMNEITQIFSRMDISIHDVLDAARTKWNFLPFVPGLVGGHCISVDPHYLSYRALQLGHEPRVILSGRLINDTMGRWIADRIHEQLGRPSRVVTLGLSFKENVPDLRNSKVVDLVQRLKWLGHEVVIHDPLARTDEAEHEYGLTIDRNALGRSYDAAVIAVAHDVYREMSPGQLSELVGGVGLIADIKGIMRGTAFPEGVKVWTL